MKTFSDKEIRLAANAIGWVFYGDQSDDGVSVEVPEEDSQKCVDAAQRALENIEQFRETIAGGEEAPESSDSFE